MRTSSLSKKCFLVKKGLLTTSRFLLQPFRAVKAWSNESWWLSSTLIDFELVQILLRLDQDFRYARGNIQSTLMQLLFSFDRSTRVEKLSCKLNSHPGLGPSVSTQEGPFPLRRIFRSETKKFEVENFQHLTMIFSENFLSEKNV